jgi:hypothetical protein
MLLENASRGRFSSFRSSVGYESDLICVFPIPLESVMVRVERKVIRHVGPVILIEGGCVFKLALAYVKDKLFIAGIDFHRKQVIAHATPLCQKKKHSLWERRRPASLIEDHKTFLAVCAVVAVCPRVSAQCAPEDVRAVLVRGQNC